jgi:hypothetical protein
VVLYPSSETESRPRGVGADCSGGPLGPPGPWALPLGCDFLECVLCFVNSFVFCLRKKMGFPPVV